jgi:TPR repeat protein
MAMSFAAALSLGACASPNFVDKSKSPTGERINEVAFEVHDIYQSDPPSCIAVLPFTPKGGVKAEDAERVRRAIYAHLAPQRKADIELPVVDFALAGMAEADRADLAKVGKRLDCGALLVGEVTEHESRFFAVYSRVAVGAELKMVRAHDGAVYWEGKHVAQAHGGGLGIDPLGVAMGVFDAASNMRDEQPLRVADDLARRLASTIPDNAIQPPSALAKVPAPKPKAPAAVRQAAVVSTPAPATHSPAGPAARGNDCDRLAAHPYDTQKVAPGVNTDRMDAAAALRACRAAIMATPTMARMQFQYARALHESGDIAEALDWYGKAADQGHAGAMNSLGYVYLTGQGAARDDAKALTLFRKAAEGGNALAQHNLGLMLSDGRGTRQNLSEGLHWHKAAARQGYPGAMHAVGLFYAHGRGVERDQAEAYYWFSRAAEQGFAAAVEQRDMAAKKLSRSQITETGRRLSGEPEKAAAAPPAKPSWWEKVSLSLGSADKAAPEANFP